MPGGPNAVTASAFSQRVGDIKPRRGRVGGARGRWGVKPWFDGKGRGGEMRWWWEEERVCEKRWW